MTLVERLRHALEMAHDGDTVLLTGDHADLDVIVNPLAQAAVLVAVTDRAPDDSGGPGVILTRRTDTRFLIITHHAVTMARMDRLFGVTMAEQGVSQLVSVDLKRAEAMVA